MSCLEEEGIGGKGEGAGSFVSLPTLRWHKCSQLHEVKALLPPHASLVWSFRSGEEYREKDEELRLEDTKAILLPN